MNPLLLPKNPILNLQQRHSDCDRWAFYFWQVNPDSQGLESLTNLGVRITAILGYNMNTDNGYISNSIAKMFYAINQLR